MKYAKMIQSLNGSRNATYPKLMSIANKADKEREELMEIAIRFGDIIGGAERHELNNLLDKLNC